MVGFPKKEEGQDAAAYMETWLPYVLGMVLLNSYNKKLTKNTDQEHPPLKTLILKTKLGQN